MRNILYISTSLPSLTLTFIYREITALEHLGHHVLTVSMNKPDEEKVSKEARSLLEKTLFLDQVPLYKKILALLRSVTLHPKASWANVWQIVTARPATFPLDHIKLVYHLAEACYLYYHLPRYRLQHIHCHFVSGPTSIGMFLARLAGLPFSFTMHASNIFLYPIALQNKLTTCKAAVSISDYNRKHVLQSYGDHYQSKLHVIRCGIELNKFTEAATGSGAASIHLLGVGRLTTMKGFEFLIRACHVLKNQHVPFHCTIVGDGEQRQFLQDLIQRLSLEEEVVLTGAVLQEQLADYYQQADIFVMPSIITAEGRRDGIPVVLMEAMAWRIPVISTEVVGIPELVQDERSGLLVKPGDSEALAAAICRIKDDNILRVRLIRNGYRMVEGEFNIEHAAAKLATLFGPA